MKENKIVYIVSYFYYPLANARSFRWTYIAAELVRQGYEVIVISGWQPNLKAYEFKDGVSIYRVGIRIIEKYRLSIGLQKKTFKNDAFTARLLRYFSLLYLKLAWPDTTCFWIYSALKKISILANDKKISTLISVTPTFSSVIIGYFLRKKVTNWILDIGDPFAFATESPANNFFLYSLYFPNLHFLSNNSTN